jgi:hypothetical protein
MISQFGIYDVNHVSAFGFVLAGLPLGGTAERLEALLEHGVALARGHAARVAALACNKTTN